MRLGWYFHRLRAMGFAELLHRVSERWKHRSDATFAATLGSLPLGRAAAGKPALPPSADAPPELKTRLAADAARLQAGEWRLYGWRQTQVGTPPRWHQDPWGDYLAPKDRPAHALDHRALPQGADVRTLWEINRWTEMTRLAMHGWLNAAPQAIATAQSWLEDWVEQNPVGYGLHWTSPLEASLRLVNFVWFDALVAAAGDPACQERQTGLAERIVAPHAAWVWRYKSFGSSANNHLLGELVGLLHAVKRWPALEARVGMAEELWSDIGRCVLDQFAPDGGNREQALHYHLFAWEMAWHAARLMEAATGPVAGRLRDAAAFFAKMIHAAEPWDYGDSDDAEVLPLGLDRYHAAGEWQAWANGTPGGETLRYWLGPPPSVSQAVAVPGAWWIAPHTGMAVLEAEGWKLRLDASPLGFGAMAAHGHEDALHLSLWDGGQALVIDPGTGGYYGMKEQRAALAAWASHNGPQPASGFKTPCRMGTFLWARHHSSPRLREEGAGAITASLRHEGGVWRRRVFLETGNRVAVEDSVEAPHPLEIRVRWLLAPGTAVEKLSSGSFRLSRGQQTWRLDLENAGSTVLQEGLASRRYGGFEECPVIEATGHLSIKSAWSRE